MDGIHALLRFLTMRRAKRPKNAPRFTAVSLFSGAGLSDIGYEHAGFQFVVQVESDRLRARLGQDNFPLSTWVVGDARKLTRKIVEAYTNATSRPLDLLVATPPCQGMSSSNPGRGKRRANTQCAHEEKNKLIFTLVPVARALSPKVIVAENVRPILTLEIIRRRRRGRLIDFIRKQLPDYEVFEGVVDVADYGVPQTRKRAIIVAVRKDQPWLRRLRSEGLLPWPSPTHASYRFNGKENWVTVRDWLEAMGYEPLDSKDRGSAKGEHPLHFVPSYERNSDRYVQISQILPYSGMSAYANSTCLECGAKNVPVRRVRCHKCGSFMRNRPYVIQRGRARLIKGFASSYRRMDADKPASTVTTNSSHVGSDFKIHPWEHRVLSILEASDLQTVPRFYDWSRALSEGRTYLIRNVVGEAFPPYFTYLHGTLLGKLLKRKRVPSKAFAPRLASATILQPRHP